MYKIYTNPYTKEQQFTKDFVKLLITSLTTQMFLYKLLKI